MEKEYSDEEIEKYKEKLDRERRKDLSKIYREIGICVVCNKEFGRDFEETSHVCPPCTIGRSNRWK